MRKLIIVCLFLVSCGTGPMIEHIDNYVLFNGAMKITKFEYTRQEGLDNYTKRMTLIIDTNKENYLVEGWANCYRCPDVKISSINISPLHNKTIVPLNKRWHRLEAYRTFNGLIQNETIKLKAYGLSL